MIRSTAIDGPLELDLRWSLGEEAQASDHFKALALQVTAVELLIAKSTVDFVSESFRR